MPIRQLGTKRTFSEGSDYFVDIIDGNKPGVTGGAGAGSNPGLSADTQEGVNNIRLETGTGAIYTYLTADTTVYVSSSSASDTQTVVIVGVDAAYTSIVRLATLNGQTPVAFSGVAFRVVAVVVISSPVVKAVGNIYVSTDNTDITLGVPNTLSKVLAKIDVGTTQGTLSHITVPLGKQLYLYNILFTSSKSTDAEISLRFRGSTTDDFSPSPPFHMFQQSQTIAEIAGTLLPEKFDVDVVATSPTAGSKVTASFSTILTDV